MQILLFLASLLLRPAAGQADPLDPWHLDGVWPFYQHDAANTGRSYCEVPVRTNGTVSWTMQLNADGPVLASPAIDADSALYIGTNGGELLRIDEDGSIEWRRDLGAPVVTSVSIEMHKQWDNRPTAYVGAGSKFFSVDCLTGALNFAPYEVGGGRVITTSAIVRDHIAINGTTAFFGAEGRVVGYDVRSGSERYVLDFTAAEDTLSSPSYGYCSLIVTTEGGEVAALNPHKFEGYPEGTPEDPYCQVYAPTKWRRSAAGPIRGSAASLFYGAQDPPIPSFPPNNQFVIVATVAGTIECVTLYPRGDLNAGDLVWTWRSPTGGAFVASPVLSEPPAGAPQIVVGSEDGTVYAVSAEGELLWTHATGAPVRSAAAVDAAGIAFVPTSDGRVLALSPQGVVLGIHDAGAGITNNLVLTARGEVVYGTEDGRLEAVSWV